MAVPQQNEALQRLQIKLSTYDLNLQHWGQSCQVGTLMPMSADSIVWHSCRCSPGDHEVSNNRVLLIEYASGRLA